MRPPSPHFSGGSTGSAGRGGEGPTATAVTIFFSLREKYPSEAKGDEGLMKFKVRNEEALTCLADARLSSPKGRGMSWHTCLANVSASDTPLFYQPSPIRDEGHEPVSGQRTRGVLTSASRGLAGWQPRTGRRT